MVTQIHRFNRIKPKFITPRCRNHYRLLMDYCNENSLDSDQVDSEDEAFLYSQIYHEHVETTVETTESAVKTVDSTAETAVTSEPAPVVAPPSPRVPAPNNDDSIVTVDELADSDASDGDVKISEEVIEIRTNNFKNRFLTMDESPDSSESSSSSSSTEESDDDSSVCVKKTVLETDLSLNMSSHGNSTYQEWRSRSLMRRFRECSIWDLPPNPSREAVLDNMKHFYDSDCSDYEVEDVWEELKDTKSCDWTITCSARKGRYYSSADMNLLCHNCKQRGHAARDCPNPQEALRCHLCSKLGHIGTTCPEKVCIVCFQPGHNRWECNRRYSLNTMECHRCGYEGHAAEYCPDKWRRFATTTEPGVEPRPFRYKLPPRRKQMWCCNCARQGHYYFECNRPTMNNVKPVSQLVTCYAAETPVETATTSNGPEYSDIRRNYKRSRFNSGSRSPSKNHQHLQIPDYGNSGFKRKPTEQLQNPNGFKRKSKSPSNGILNGFNGSNKRKSKSPSVETPSYANGKTPRKGKSKTPPKINKGSSPHWNAFAKSCLEKTTRKKVRQNSGITMIPQAEAIPEWKQSVANYKQQQQQTKRNNPRKNNNSTILNSWRLDQQNGQFKRNFSWNKSPESTPTGRNNKNRAEFENGLKKFRRKEKMIPVFDVL